MKKADSSKNRVKNGFGLEDFGLAPLLLWRNIIRLTAYVFKWPDE